MSSYFINAEFEDIEAPELIASSLHILQKNGWEIINFTNSELHAKRTTVGGETANFSFKIQNFEISIQCESDLNFEATKHTVELFIENLHDFVSQYNFDNKVRELKHHYFMANPLSEVENTTTAEVPGNFKALFSFRKSFWVTPTLVGLNAVVFIAMLLNGVSLFNPETEEILYWGGNFRSLVLDGEWWRLITCCFIHIGLIHILFNMWALYNIGAFLERMIGSGRFAFGYFIAGLAGSLNSIVWHYATPSAGASGAIFGMFGLFLALLTTNILEKGFRDSMLRSIVPMILFNLLLGTSAMIDNAGHVGGLVAGLICGYLFAWHYKNPKNKLINYLSFIIPTVLLVGSVWAVKLKLPDPYKEFKRLTTQIDTLEKQALAIEESGVDSSNFKTTMAMWDTIIVDIHKLKNMKLDRDVDIQHDKLNYYFNQRKLELESIVYQTDSLKQHQIRNNIDSILIIINSAAKDD